MIFFFMEGDSSSLGFGAFGPGRTNAAVLLSKLDFNCLYTTRIGMGRPTGASLS
jgi:hypothetical protein